MSNLSRFVLIIWVFVVLILTSSYTACLTSRLTVQQLAVTGINQVSSNGEYVGYQSGSYVGGILTSLNVDKSKLKALDNLDEYAEALSKGSKKGGVSAICDETPYIKLLLSNYCDKYAMVGLVSDTTGFGFVFRKGSPLVQLVSKALLEVKQSEKMRAIDLKWFGNKTNCEDLGSTDSPESLTVDRFRGLFLVTVITSIFAVFLSFCVFIHKHMHVLTNTTTRDDSIGKRLVSLIKLFYEEDFSCASGLTELNQANVIDPEGHTRTLSASTASTSSPSTSEEIYVGTQGEDVLSIEVEIHSQPSDMGTIEISPKL